MPRPPTELEPKLLDAVRPGDAIMVKGSLGSRMAPLVEAMKRRFGAQAARPDGPGEGERRCSIG